MIGKTYRTEHGMPVRVVALHTFEGVEYAFAEALQIGGGQADMEAVVALSLTPMAAEEFDAELAKVRKHTSAKAKQAEIRAEAERYGIKVIVNGSGGVRGHATIVRCTATRWVALDGSAYTRQPRRSYKNGKRIGTSSWGWASIDAEGLKMLEHFAGKRDRIDIVAERKAATEAGCDHRE